MTVVGSYEFNLEDEYAPVGFAFPELTAMMNQMFQLLMLFLLISILMAMIPRREEKKK